MCRHDSAAYNFGQSGTQGSVRGWQKGVGGSWSLVMKLDLSFRLTHTHIATHTHTLGTANFTDSKGTKELITIGW